MMFRSVWHDCGIAKVKSLVSVDSQGFLFVPEAGLEPAHF